MPDTTQQSSFEDTTFSINIPPAKDMIAGDGVSVLGPSPAPQSEEEITVYTMPKEFVGVKGNKGKRKKTESGIVEGNAEREEVAAALPNRRTKFIIGIIILIFFAITGGSAGYFLLKGRRVETPPPPPVMKKLQAEPAQTEEPAATPEPPQEDEQEASQTQNLSAVLSGDLIQKPVVSYNDRGMKTTEAVLSLEKEQNVNYKVITINEYIVSERQEYFAYVAGQPYELQLRGEAPKGRGVLTITYSEELLQTLDIIPADLRIGYLPFSRLKETLYRRKDESSGIVSVAADGPEPSNQVEVQEDEDGEINEEIIDDAISTESEQDEVNEEQDGSVEDMGDEEATSFSDVVVWDILKAQDLDDDIRSISSVLEEAREGIYAIVPMNANDLIDLPDEPEETPAPPFDEEIVPAIDSDRDNLSDREELLYGTSPLSPDSDGDGYADGPEVVNLYSPARGSSVRLESDTQFSEYTNTAGGYSFLIPRQFVGSGLDYDKPGDIIVTSSEKEAIVMSIEENPGGLSLPEWLASISPSIQVSEFESFVTQSGLNALAAPQKTTYYISLPASRSVLVVSYTSPVEYSYMTTTRMVVESVTLNDQ